LVPARQWTDQSGQFRRDGEYAGQLNGQVWIRSATGATYRVSIDRLSSADQDFIASLTEQGLAPSRTAPAAQSNGRRIVNSSAAIPLTTLSHRIPRLDGAVADPAVARRATIQRTSDAIMRLTGWHCHGGHCYTVHNYHHVPHMPCPKPVDHGKRIMKGWHSRFHLVNVWDPKNPDNDGTGAYNFVDSAGCCHLYLELLQVSQAPSTNFDLWYKVVDSTPDLKVTHWHFKRILFTHNSYHVYYSVDGTNYTYYDTACAIIAE
jgi:hypothetical protein